MTDKTKMQDRRIWARMGWELAAIEQLIGSVLCDGDYNAVMDKKTWDKLFKAIHIVNDVRSRADVRSSQQGVFFYPEPFYGSAVAPARKLTDEYRKTLLQEAMENAEQLYGKKEAKP